jgi:hypothetical protein
MNEAKKIVKKRHWRKGRGGERGESKGREEERRQGRGRGL